MPPIRTRSNGLALRRSRPFCVRRSLFSRVVSVYSYQPSVPMPSHRSGVFLWVQGRSQIYASCSEGFFGSSAWAERSRLPRFSGSFSSLSHWWVSPRICVCTCECLDRIPLRRGLHLSSHRLRRPLTCAAAAHPLATLSGTKRAET